MAAWFFLLFLDIIQKSTELSLLYKRDSYDIIQKWVQRRTADIEEKEQYSSAADVFRLVKKEGKRMNQKKNNPGKGLVCLILLLVVIAVTGFFAMDTFEKSKLVTDENGVTMFQDGGIKLGLDLAGGVSITYQTVVEEPDPVDLADTVQTSPASSELQLRG